MLLLSIILAWLKVHWLDVVVVAVFAGVIVWLLRRGKVDTVKQIILYLVVRAERELGSGTGPLKFAAVITALYSYLPFTLRLLFTKAELTKFLEDAVVILKKRLSEPGTNLLTYEQEALVTGTFSVTGDTNQIFV